MNTVKIAFDQMEWIKSAVGVFEKRYKIDRQVIRLIRFESDFVETD